MREVAYILFGAAFTVAVSLAMGRLLLARLRLVFHRGEAALFEFVAGSACLSFLVAILCAVHHRSQRSLSMGRAGYHFAGLVASPGRSQAQEFAGSIV